MGLINLFEQFTSKNKVLTIRKKPRLPQRSSSGVSGGRPGGRRRSAVGGCGGGRRSAGGRAGGQVPGRADGGRQDGQAGGRQGGEHPGRAIKATVHKSSVELTNYTQKGTSLILKL